ncbi:hypothetical protein [Burkholderia lata]|uniref:hypothetical protein n=1 Tax=Burkholderia lata (strain ATCC 17760 / DSM 23089 / LMG 22485 / NCIMB 9086 / R18194 / 383) TaxID=482957 RepID=UPI0014547977|nr:hypothetical protein BLA15816_04246 [Burkholderia lata]
MSVTIASSISSDSTNEALSAGEKAQAGALPADFKDLYESALQSLQQMLRDVFAEVGASEADLDSGADSGMDTQSAAGALAAYMHENGINTLDPNQLYQLANNRHTGTPSDVSAAAAFMLENSDTFNQIETHDMPSADGIAGVADFDWAAQGGFDEEDQASGSDQSGETSFSIVDLEQAEEEEREANDQAVFGKADVFSQTNQSAMVDSVN